MSEYNLVNLYRDSVTCCEIAGQDKELSKIDKLSQFKIIQSEVIELLEEIEKDNLVGQADACIDILVTVFGMIKKLENQGMNTSLVMQRIAENNLSKFPCDEQTAIDSSELYIDQGTYCTIGYSSKHQRYVIRDDAGKYRKPIGFQDVDTTNWFLG